MSNLVTYRPEINFFPEENEEETTFDWENEIIIGKGIAYGIETAFQKNIGTTTGWINYNLAWSDRTYPIINNGEKFPFRYNRRHEIKLGLSHQFTPIFNLFVTWKYGSGQWTSIEQYNYDLFIPVSPINSNILINNYQLKAFHKLDINANFNWEKGRCRHHLALGIYNAYNRNNSLFARTNVNENSSLLEEFGLGTILPTFKYSLEF